MQYKDQRISCKGKEYEQVLFPSCQAFAYAKLQVHDKDNEYYIYADTCEKQLFLKHWMYLRQHKRH